MLSLRIRLTSRLLATLFLTPTLGWTALTWQTREIELKANPGDPDITAVFRFTNTGNTPVTITSVDPSCGCTTAELAKPIYAAGETGEIKAVFTLGDRTGLQEKSILVTTAEAPASPDTLVLKVNIIERLTCSPRLLLWRKGAPAANKVATITAATGQKIESIEPDPATTGKVSVQIEAIEPGTRFHVTIQPASLTETTSFPVNFLAHFADHTTQRFTLYVLVK